MILIRIWYPSKHSHKTMINKTLRFIYTNSTIAILKFKELERYIDKAVKYVN